MSLNWNATDLPNMPWEVQSEEERNRTANMAWTCMAIHLGTITEANWEEFYARYALWCRLHNEPINIEPIDVYLRIGFSTNVTTETFSKWSKRQLDQFMSDHRETAFRDEQLYHEGITFEASNA